MLEPGRNTATNQLSGSAPAFIMNKRLLITVVVLCAGCQAEDYCLPAHVSRAQRVEVCLNNSSCMVDSYELSIYTRYNQCYNLKENDS